MWVGVSTGVMPSGSVFLLRQFRILLNKMPPCYNSCIITLYGMNVKINRKKDRGRMEAPRKSPKVAA